MLKSLVTSKHPEQPNLKTQSLFQIDLRGSDTCQISSTFLPLQRSEDLQRIKPFCSTVILQLLVCWGDIQPKSLRSRWKAGSCIRGTWLIPRFGITGGGLFSSPFYALTFSQQCLPKVDHPSSALPPASTPSAFCCCPLSGLSASGHLWVWHWAAVI